MAWRGARACKILPFELLDHRYRVDLDAHVARKPRDLHGCPRRRRIEDKATVDLVHRDEIIQIGEKHGRADDVFEAAAGGLEQRADVSHDTIGLTADIAVHDRARCRVDRDLAGDEKKIAGTDRW